MEPHSRLAIQASVARGGGDGGGSGDRVPTAQGLISESKSLTSRRAQSHALHSNSSNQIKHNKKQEKPRGRERESKECVGEALMRLCALLCPAAALALPRWSFGWVVGCERPQSKPCAIVLMCIDGAGRDRAASAGLALLLGIGACKSVFLKTVSRNLSFSFCFFFF